MPVFLIYAGILHAIGLALLLPIMISLPRPESDIAPGTSVINVEIAPTTSSAAIMGTDEETAELPAPLEAAPDTAALAVDDAATHRAAAEPAAAGTGDAEQVIAPEAEPKEAAVEEKTEEDAAKSVKPARAPAKKSATTRTAKPVARSAKAPTRIAPFNGALSGLFSPGAPAKRR